MANTKITALTAATSLDDDDIFPLVADPLGTPANRKIAASALRAGLLGTHGTVDAVGGAATLVTNAGVVTSESLTIAAGSDYTLTFTNGRITPSTIVLVTLTNGTNTIAPIYAHTVTPGSGSCTIKVRNAHASLALNGTIKIGFFLV